MNCKFCQAELEEGVTLCPACGRDNTEDEAVQAEEAMVTPEEETPVQETTEKKKLSSGKLSVICISIVAVLAVLAAFVITGIRNGTLHWGNKNDVTCKSSYTVDNEKVQAKGDKVVATAGDGKLTNAELQIHYWMYVYNFMGNYGSYAASYGLDASQPFDQQDCKLSTDGWNWQQYFLDAVLQDWTMYNALYQEAKAVGFESTLDLDADWEAMLTSLEETATSQGYATVEEMVRADMGTGATLDAYRAYVELVQTGYDYYSHLSQTLVPSEEQIRGYYEDNLALFEENGITDDGSLFVDVRHILIKVENSEDEASWADCEKKAQDLLDQWLAGEASQDSFAALANEHSADGGSNTKGGLYTYVKAGDMLPAFNDWCFDASRQPGDYGLVKTVHGYHIMYYVQGQPVWYVYAKNSAQSQLVKDTIEALTEKYAADVKYSAIVLGTVDQSGEDAE